MDTSLTPAKRLRERLAKPGILVAPGVYDQVSLALASRAGFETVFASGYWNAASALGEPDVGIAGATDFLQIFGRFAAKSDTAIIADADTGFGSLTNLDRAVKAYQHAGIAAIQIEDQEFPKVCGHVGNASCVPTADMVKRVEVAVEAVGDGDMLIIARTDAHRAEGLEAAIDRSLAYGEAGADIVFLEGPRSEEEIATAASALSYPLLINAAHGGFTPVLPPHRYEELGVKVVLYPAGAPLSAAKGADDFYKGLAAGNPNTEKVDMFDFAEMSKMMGMSEVIEFQKRHGAP